MAVFPSTAATAAATATAKVTKNCRWERPLLFTSFNSDQTSKRTNERASERAPGATLIVATSTAQHIQNLNSQCLCASLNL